MSKLSGMLAFIIWLASGCGERGETGAKRPPLAPSSNLEDGQSQGEEPSTYVLTDLAPYSNPQIVGCLRSGMNYGDMPKLAAVQIDGKFDDWEQIPPATNDPVGDASAQTDFSTVKIARRDNDLAIAVVTNNSDEKYFHVEIGGAFERAGRFEMVRRRLYRGLGSQVSELIGNNLNPKDIVWRPLAQENFQLSVGDSGVELLLKERELGDVLTWPIVWLKFYTQGINEVTSFDASSTAAYGSLVSDEQTSQFAFTGCQFWQGQAEPLHLKLVTDREATLESRQKIDPVETVASWTFALTRAAFDAASRELGGLHLPVGETTVFVTDAKILREPSSLVGALYPDTAYNGVILSARELAVNGADYYPQGAIIERSIAHFIRLKLTGIFAEAPPSLLQAVTQALTDYVVQRTLGYNFWLDYYPDSIAAFISSLDSNEPKPLSSTRWYPKEIGFGHLLSAMIPPKSLLDSWTATAHLVRKGEDPYLALLLALKEIMPDEPARSRLENLWNGWIRQGSYANDFAPIQLIDGDRDGIPSFIETMMMGTNPSVADTDSDGWTDWAEFVGNGDAKISTVKPSVLSPDGSFSDWLELMPQKVIIDRGHTGACPRATDISHYAAVAGQDDIMIGAFAQDYLDGETAAHWEVVLDLPKQEQQLLITMTGGSGQFLVTDSRTGLPLLVRKRAIPMDRGTLEIPLSRLDLGLKPWTLDRNTLKIRIRTIYRLGEDEKFCDETGWFSPEFNQ